MSKTISNAARILGKKGCHSRSPAKLAACRENAKKAGRKPMSDLARITKAIVAGGKGRVSQADAEKFAAEIVKVQGGAK